MSCNNSNRPKWHLPYVNFTHRETSTPSLLDFFFSFSPSTSFCNRSASLMCFSWPMSRLTISLQLCLYLHFDSCIDEYHSNVVRFWSCSCHGSRRGTHWSLSCCTPYATWYDLMIVFPSFSSFTFFLHKFDTSLMDKCVHDVFLALTFRCAMLVMCSAPWVGTSQWHSRTLY